MCGRSSLHDAPRNVLEFFDLPPMLPGFAPRYNIAPSQDQWTLAIGSDGSPTVKARKWGLVPYWAQDAAIGNRMINARAEAIMDKPAFREPMQTRRCLVLADGYYEWTGSGKSKTPHFFHMAAHRSFPMAGLWERWKQGETILETCTIITTAAGSRTSAYHHRMPVLLTLERATEWLDRATPFSRLGELLTAYEAADLECYEVSRFVNSPGNDSPQCIAPASELTA